MSPHTHRSCPLVSHCPKAKPESPSLELLSRRDWVKRFVLGSVTAIGSDWKGTLLADISPGAYPGNVLTFKISDYPALQNDYGSVRFSLFEGTSTNDGIIIITRAPGNIFYAISARCTHQQQAVDAYLVEDETKPEEGLMICYGHGSTYDIQGRLIHPAEENQAQANLPTYQTSYSNGILKVEIPTLNLRVNKVSLASTTGNKKRLQLSFPARANGTYKLRYTPDITTAPLSANFAKTVDGSINQESITTTRNETLNIWVDSMAKRGFYLVELSVRPY